MTTPILSDHQWPERASEHVWGPWMAFSASGGTFTQYRKCAHPLCGAVEYREVPK